MKMENQLSPILRKKEVSFFHKGVFAIGTVTFWEENGTINVDKCVFQKSVLDVVSDFTRDVESGDIYMPSFLEWCDGFEQSMMKKFYSEIEK